jgi:hypothetical protein
VVNGEKNSDTPLWQSALGAKEETEAQRRFESLWAKGLCPKVRAFLRSKGVKDDDLEDLLQDTSLRLWQALCKPCPPGSTIGNMPAYAKRVAFSVLAEYLGRKLKQQPNKRKLLHAVWDALNAGEIFACWEQRHEKWCGLASWSGKASRTSARMDDFQAGKYEDFLRIRLGNRAAREFVGEDFSRLPILMAHLLVWIEMPLPVNELVLHLAQMLAVADMRFESFESLEEERGREPFSTDDKELFADPFTREYLKQFGFFLCKADLTRCERGATALALTRECVVVWLQIPMTALAEALGYAPQIPERFQVFRLTIWRQIPRTEEEALLTDQAIADLLEIAPTSKTSARQMVANCRSTTRNRKWPLWLKSFGWGE